MRRLLPQPAEKARPDVSLAIVNIVLLLIFFFLTTGSLTSSVTNTVLVSETYDLPIDQLPHPVLIIEGENSISFNGEPATLEQIPELMADWRVLHILVAREAPAKRLLTLLDRPELDPYELRLVTIHRRSAS